MGRKCAVPHCYTGYRKCKDKASLYRVPDDDFFLSKWQEAIARDDRPITPKDYVCEKHFKDDDIMRKRIIKDVVEVYQRPRLKPDAIPSIFPDLPEFVLKMVKKRRKMPSEDEQAAKICDSLKDNPNGENREQNVIEQNSTVEEIKTELPEATEDGNIARSTSKTSLSNELDIKSEPEEHTDRSMESDENETNDALFELTKMHHCDQCDYQTKYPHNLRTHKTKHLTGDEAYIHCEHCPKFKTKWELTYRNHLKIKHGLGKQELFKCSICPFATKVKLCLKRHLERHQKDTPGQPSNNLIACEQPAKNFKCTECFYETNSKTHIIRHIKSAHNTGDDTAVAVNNVERKPLYRCLKCSYRCKTHKSFLKHVLKHDGLKQPSDVPKSKVWKCPKCPFATFFQHALYKHQETECGNSLTCKKCSFKTSSTAEFVKHSLMHESDVVEPVKHEIVDGNLGNGVQRSYSVGQMGAVQIGLENGRDGGLEMPEFITVKTEVPDLE